MRQYFVDMQLIYANMQNNYVHMQLHHKTCRVRLHRVSKTFDCIQISDCKQNNVALEKHTINSIVRLKGLHWPVVCISINYFQSFVLVLVYIRFLHNLETNKPR